MAAFVQNARWRLKHYQRIRHARAPFPLWGPSAYLEAITRMLRYFQSEGMIKLSRGAVRILDPVRLEELHHA